MDKEINSEYEVGYKRPPRKTQFKKGQSGNPRGRKKNTRTFTEAFVKELSEHMFIEQNGKKIKAKKMDVIAKQIVNLALKGNIYILKKFLDYKLLDQDLLKLAFKEFNPDPNKVGEPSQKIKILVAAALEVMNAKIAEGDTGEEPEIQTDDY